MKVFSSVEQLIGHTPLLELTHLEKGARVLAKLEGFNPGGSAKDRVALSMITTAGELSPDTVIVEPTSGNTGIGLSMLAAVRGCRAIIVMPDSMSEERQLLMRAYGAEVVLTPGAEGMSGAVRKAQELVDTLPHAILAGQFTNPANPAAHYATTGPEIWEDTNGKVDIFVAGVGTGGTLTGVGRYLKEKDPAIRVVAVEPSGSPVLSGGKAGPHGLQGIGAGYVPAVLDTAVYDEVITVTEAEATAAARALAKSEGILSGISSGAALHAALMVAARPENAGKTVVVLLPDTGERYLSTGLYC